MSARYQSQCLFQKKGDRKFCLVEDLGEDPDAEAANGEESNLFMILKRMKQVGGPTN